MAGYTGLLKGWLQTLIGWRRPDSLALGSVETPAAPLGMAVLKLSPPAMSERPLLSPERATEATDEVDVVPAQAESVTAKAEETVMADTTETAGAKKQTWLQKAGTWLQKTLHIGVEVAEVAEPVVDMAVPAVAELYNGTVGLFVSSEAAFGAAPGSGAAKLSASVPAVTAYLKTWADENGFEVIDAEVSKWASVFVDSLNAVPIVKKATT